ncbi:hypothetical protein C0Q70_17915 [Pomacea canaliculata]|uniref:Uncharacterized protein n=1 Tax=Pomacea canaliculata TaxID=400727 RepID=A0A2T7NLS3_POMCA|nr:hypothetical protein C0Q70_17915 [Pomacea canaliculata]
MMDISMSPPAAPEGKRHIGGFVHLIKVSADPHNTPPAITPAITPALVRCHTLEPSFAATHSSTTLAFSHVDDDSDNDNDGELAREAEKA